MPRTISILLPTRPEGAPRDERRTRNTHNKQVRHVNVFNTECVKHQDLYVKGHSYPGYSSYIMMGNMNDSYMSNGGSLSPPMPRTSRHGCVKQTNRIIALDHASSKISSSWSAWNVLVIVQCGEERSHTQSMSVLLF
ncbi:lymphoid enhancer-binding factor 1 [Corythoichthys intestinalis]|uniref:lymphoid enhancer-binding factor 1 n=1 Tax=Corythoichthys intestinalis TaxID=161448 RepID=UPI0025A6802C|nr:lymphoid enhancer-binding factor 1 [Corythoichthys intestinalis]